MQSSDFDTAMRKDFNHPVYPVSKTVNASIISSFTLTGRYCFELTPDFVEQVQMNEPWHECLCFPAANPVEHSCCSGCRLGPSTTHGRDLQDYHQVLGNYDFSETDPVQAVRQMLKLLVSNIPMSLYNCSRMFDLLAPADLTTFFFANLTALHNFAAHLAHACERYRCNEEFLQDVYHSAMYAGDYFAVSQEVNRFAALEITQRRVTSRVFLDYLGGGVGICSVLVDEETLKTMLDRDRDRASGVDPTAIAGKMVGAVGVYLFPVEEPEKEEHSKNPEEKPEQDQPLDWARTDMETLISKVEGYNHMTPEEQKKVENWLKGKQLKAQREALGVFEGVRYELTAHGPDPVGRKKRSAPWTARNLAAKHGHSTGETSFHVNSNKAQPSVHQNAEPSADIGSVLPCDEEQNETLNGELFTTDEMDATQVAGQEPELGRVSISQGLYAGLDQTMADEGQGEVNPNGAATYLAELAEAPKRAGEPHGGQVDEMYSDETIWYGGAARRRQFDEQMHAAMMNEAVAPGGGEEDIYFSEDHELPSFDYSSSLE